MKKKKQKYYKYHKNTRRESNIHKRPGTLQIEDSSTNLKGTSINIPLYIVTSPAPQPRSKIRSVDSIRSSYTESACLVLSI